MGTKNNPGDFDCYTNAEPDEPMFILLARDEKAPALVHEWVRMRIAADPSKGDDAKTREALACALAMENWRTKRSRAVVDEKGSTLTVPSHADPSEWNVGDELDCDMRWSDGTVGRYWRVVERSRYGYVVVEFVA